MRKIILAGAAAAATTLAVLGGAGMASASTGPCNGQAGQLTGQHAATYNDAVFGPVRCNETQHPKFDTVSCQSTSGLPLTGVTAGQVGSVGWLSDFNGTFGTLSFTVSADGLSYTAHAAYGS